MTIENHLNCNYSKSILVEKINTKTEKLIKIFFCNNSLKNNYLKKVKSLIEKIECYHLEEEIPNYQKLKSIYSRLIKLPCNNPSQSQSSEFTEIISHLAQNRQRNFKHLLDFVEEKYSEEDRPALLDFISGCAHAELEIQSHLQKKAIESVPQSPKAKDIHDILMHVCGQHIFPRVINASETQQQALQEILDEWLKLLLPSLLSASSPIEKKTPQSSEMENALLLHMLSAFSSFIKDYTKALKANRQGLLSRWISPITANNMDQKIARSLTQQEVLQEKQILSDFTKEIFHYYMPQEAPSFASYQEFADILKEIIDSITDSPLLPQMINSMILDENPLENMHSYKKEVSLENNPQMSPELQNKTLESIEALIDLGHPGWLPWMTKLLLIKLPQKTPASITLLLSQILGRCKSLVPEILKFQSHSQTNRTQLDVQAFALHLFQKYFCGKDFSNIDSSFDKHKQISDKERSQISEQLFDRIYSVAKKMLPYHLGKVVTTTEYIPFIKAFPALARTLTVNILDLMQRPNSLRVFVYKYLLQENLLPFFQKLNAAQNSPSQPLMQTYPQIFDQIGKEGSDFLSLYIKDYVIPLIFKDTPSRKNFEKVTSNIITALLPKIIVQNLNKIPSFEDQQRTCELFYTLGQFLNDFAKARELLKHPYSSPEENFSAEERRESLIKALDKVRLSRGAASLKFGSEEKKQKLELLSQLIVHSLEKSNLDKKMLEDLLKILPPALENLISLLSPHLINQLLLSIFSSKNNYSLAPLSFLEMSWDLRNIEKWNQSLIPLFEGILRLGKLTDNNTVNIGLALYNELLSAYGSQIAEITPSSSAFLDPAGILNIIRILRSSLWTEDEEKNLHPTLGPVLGLTPAQKEELKKQVIQLFKEKTKLPATIQQGLQIIQADFLETSIESGIDGLLELIQNPDSLEILIYQYFLEDMLPYFLEQIKTGTDSTMIFASMDTKTAMDAASIYWKIPEEPFFVSPAQQTSSQEIFSSLNNMLDAAESSVNLTNFLSIVQKWKNKKWIDDRIATNLQNAFSSKQILMEMIPHLHHLQENKIISEEEAKYLAMLCQKDKIYLVFSYLDHIQNATSFSMDTASMKKQLLAYVRNEPNDFIHSLIIKNVQTLFSQQMDWKDPRIFFLEIQRNIETGLLSEEEATLQSIKKFLEECKDLRRVIN
ncbi:MAG: hypothetical protein Tsb0015_09400 [Simkaniaceae bacterium]